MACLPCFDDTEPDEDGKINGTEFHGLCEDVASLLRHSAAVLRETARKAIEVLSKHNSAAFFQWRHLKKSTFTHMEMWLVLTHGLRT